MLILYAILIASVGLVDASAIKGHQRSHEETARSIKLAPAANNLDKSAKSAPQVASAPVVPILESTKKIYNDESIRRLAQQPLAVEPASKPVAADPVVPVAPVVQQSPPVIKPVVVEPVIPKVPVVAPVASPVAEQPASVPVKEQAVPEPKSAPVEPVVPMAPAAPVKPVEELPPQSDRSAPLRNEVSVAVAPVVEPIVSKPVVEQPAIAQQAPQPAEPAVAEPTVKVLDSPLQAKKDEANAFVPPVLEPLHIEVPAPDPGLVLSEPIDSTTKLLIDLDEHVQKFLPAEEQQQPAQPQKDQALVAGVDYSPAVPVISAPADPTGKSSGPLVPYSSTGADNEPIVPPLPSLDGVEKASAGQPAVVSAPAQPAAPASSSSSSSAASPSATRQAGHQNHQNQQQVITQLLDQLDTLQNRIQDTINQLVARRRYVMSALLRPMGTYVRRVRTNLERLQNRVNQLQAAAVSVGGGNNRPGGFVDAAAIDTIRRRIDDISKRISDIVNRIRFSLTPTSAPMNSNGRK